MLSAISRLSACSFLTESRKSKPSSSCTINFGEDGAGLIGRRKKPGREDVEQAFLKRTSSNKRLNPPTATELFREVSDGSSQAAVFSFYYSSFNNNETTATSDENIIVPEIFVSKMTTSHEREVNLKLRQQRMKEVEVEERLEVKH